MIGGFVDTNKELDYSKLKLLNNILSGMQVNYFFIALMFFIVLWTPVTIMVIFANIEQLTDPGVFVICGIQLLLFLLIPISLKIGKKKNYTNIALNNCKKFQLATNLQQFAEDVEISLKKNIVYKSRLVVATDEYLLLWGEDDTLFNPVIVPREMIIKSDIIYGKKGIYGSNRRINVMGIFVLRNDIKIEALLCGQFEKKALEKLQKCEIV